MSGGFADRLAALAASTDRRVLALYDQYVAGRLTADEFVQLAEAVLDAGQGRASAVADIAAATAAGALLGRVLLPIGIRVTLAEIRAELDPQEPIGRPLASLLDNRDDISIETTDRVKAAGQATYKRSLARHGVRHWRRRLDGTACELCRALAADTLPITAPMYRHRGCGCTTQPSTERTAA